MGRAVIDVLEQSFRKHGTHGPQTAGLVEWIRKEISRATTDAVFGPQNPYRDPALLDAFWSVISNARFCLA